MSDFILPDDIYQQIQHAADDIADAWRLLDRACVVKQFPMDIAHAQVDRYVNHGLFPIEAIRKVYHEITKS